MTNHTESALLPSLKTFTRGAVLGALIIIGLNSAGHIIAVDVHAPGVGYTDEQAERMQKLNDALSKNGGQK